MAARDKLRTVLSVALLMVVGGCGYHGEAEDNPLTRKGTWFSFLSGDDLKEQCRPGVPDRFRLVYNGRWNEQVRIYEWGEAAPLQMDQRVIGPADLSHFTLTGVAAPWAGLQARTTLSVAQAGQLVGALRQSGLEETPPVGQEFASDSFYWVVTACEQGRFRFNAWKYDGTRAITFDKPLLALDQTGVPFNAPHALDSLDVANKSRDDRQRWYIRITADGVTGAVGF